MNLLRLLPYTRALPFRLPGIMPRGGSMLPMLVAAGIGLFAARPELLQRLTQDPRNLGSTILFAIAVIGFLGAAARSFGAFIQLAFWGALVVFFGKGFVSLPNLTLPSFGSAISRFDPASEPAPSSRIDDSPVEYVNFDSLDAERRSGRSAPIPPQTWAAPPATSAPVDTDASIADLFRRFDQDTPTVKSLPTTASPFGASPPLRGSSPRSDSIGTMFGRLPQQLVPNSDSSLPDSAYFPPARRNNPGLEFLQRR